MKEKNMLEFTIDFKGNILNIKIQEDGQCIPATCQIARIAGLTNIVNADLIEEVYTNLNLYEFDEVCKLIAFHEDITSDEAKRRLINHLLIDLGFRITYDRSDENKINDMLFTQSFISGLLDEFMTNQEIIGLVNKQGFHIKYIQ